LRSAGDELAEGELSVVGLAGVVFVALAFDAVFVLDLDLAFDLDLPRVAWLPAPAPSGLSLRATEFMQ
jgi:hypothetical protein